MGIVNITEYKNNGDGYKCYFGKTSLKKGYYFADGDESFYALVGENSCYSMTELLYPDDVADFLDAEARLGEGVQYLIVRMRCYDQQYHYLYFEMRRNGRELDGFRSFDISLCEFMELKDRYTFYMRTIKKYREFLGLLSQCFFEYTFATDEINIYHYVNMRSVPIIKCYLEDIRNRLMRSEEPASVKTGFEMLYDVLKHGTDQFDVTITLPSYCDEVIQGSKEYQRRFKGRLMYRDGVRDLSVGTISVVGGMERQKSYYMSDSAYDPGTGLFNKRAINEYTIERLHECEHTHESLYLAMIDVDDFKTINDTYGHMFGDEVLSGISELIRSVMDSRGVAGRFGGDEFMVLFENVESEKDLRRIIKTMTKNIQWAFADKADSLSITTSWGIAKYPEDGTSLEELFKKADKALYIAKAKGKNRYIIYDEQKHGNTVTDKQIRQSSGIRATLVSDSRKAQIIQELTLRLYKEGKMALKSVMEQVCASFDIDGAAVYIGGDMHRSISVGKYVNPIQNLNWIKEEAYQKLFDEQGIYIESTMSRLKGSYKEACRMYEKQENGKFVQCMARRDGRPAAVVAFDFFNRSPKLGVSDTGLIRIIGTLIAEIAAE